MRLKTITAGLAVALLAAGTVSTAPTASALTATSDATLVDALHNHRPVTLVGIGSSVGAGATLPDKAAQSPVGHLGQLFRDRFPASPLTVANLSVNGSTAWDGKKVYTDQVRPLHPTALLVAFGMNDGQTAQYNAGETLRGSISAMQSIVDAAEADGVTVLIATTPSPHTDRDPYAMPAGVPVSYPTVDGDLVPSMADSVTTIGGQPFTARHAAWNDRVRSLAASNGVRVIDAGQQWTRAERYVGQDALFNAGEYVHPNLLGHALAYWKAEDIAVELIADEVMGRA